MGVALTYVDKRDTGGEAMISLIFQVVHHDSKVQTKTKFLQSLISVLEIAGTYTIQKINSLNL